MILYVCYGCWTPWAILSETGNTCAMNTQLPWATLATVSKIPTMLVATHQPVLHPKWAMKKTPCWIGLGYIGCI